MINHGRTLLLNIFAQSAGTRDAGYEYIPPAFRPLVIPSALRIVRGVLFGKQPDQRFLNLRARELLSYIHQTELAQYLYALDSRITYWPEQETTTFKYEPKVTVKQRTGPETPIAFSGDFVVGNAGGKAAREFLVQLAASAQENLHIAVTEVGAITTTYTQIPNLTNMPVITLPETQIKFRINNMPNVSAPANGTQLATWSIALAANPPPAITTLMPTLELLGEPVFLELFGVESTEPYATFKNVWFDHPLPAYKLAGLTLAFIYRLEEVRLNRNG